MINALPKQRRPTYHFLNFAQSFNAVHLSILINADDLKNHRSKVFKLTGRKISYTAYMIHFISKALEKFPEVNVSIRHTLFPKIIRHKRIHGKFTMDKMAGSERVVIPGVVRNANQQTLREIQDVVESYKGSDYQQSPLFEKARLLARIPTALGRMLYRFVMSDLSKREKIQGTFTVTSLGHNNITNFFPIISSTVCFGIGKIEQTPIVHNNEISIANMLNLNMSFDHAAIDGALASDFLNHIKTSIENIGAGTDLM